MTRPTVMRCVMLADGTPGPAGEYLATYDESTGFSVWTPFLDKAKVFEDPIAAYAFWTQILPSQPFRPWDGRPNRPLTAFSVTMEPLEG